MTNEKLLELKKEVDEASAKVFSLEGEKKALLRQLKEVHKCSTLDTAKELTASLQKKANKLSGQLEKGIDELEKKYGNLST